MSFTTVVSLRDAEGRRSASLRDADGGRPTALRAAPAERPRGATIVGGLRQLRLGEAAGAAPVAGASVMTDQRPGGRKTLDDALVGAWESLSAHRTVSCPVCHGVMAPRYGAGPGPVGGRCADCDATLG